VTTHNQPALGGTPALKRRSRGAGILACVVVFLCTSLTAENHKKEAPAYALIFGTVWSAGGQPVAGVPVRIRPAEENRTKWRLVSDRRGEFAQRVPAKKAEYIVWADVKVPKGQSPPEARVRIEHDERVDISLHLTQ
jgi:hypothetical protein